MKLNNLKNLILTNINTSNNYLPNEFYQKKLDTIMLELMCFDFKKEDVN